MHLENILLVTFREENTSFVLIFLEIKSVEVYPRLLKLTLKLPDCRAISLDSGYLDSRWTPLWNALAAAQNDMNAFDKAADALGAAYFGVREYEFQAFKYYAARRAWCMAKHPEYAYLG
ncbi:hypothetical protein HDU79_004817 [Rhizoclosmatium sp. JEL0117]|nr:hypothetical protein HDU79_004817 [Rhizoclosmatium sp. JEL0117]